mmetsp:Transcript_4354/g.11983  ORF Transcript_4354/g.11983 Transcript_4354/m.11983 type:complete len:211 (-) Transcript_4354:420-1052(-)
MVASCRIRSYILEGAEDVQRPGVAVPDPLPAPGPARPPPRELAGAPTTRPRGGRPDHDRAGPRACQTGRRDAGVQRALHAVARQRRPRVGRLAQPAGGRRRCRPQVARGAAGIFQEGDHADDQSAGRRWGPRRGRAAAAALPAPRRLRAGGGRRPPRPRGRRAQAPATAALPAAPGAVQRGHLVAAGRSEARGGTIPAGCICRSQLRGSP